MNANIHNIHSIDTTIRHSDYDESGWITLNVNVAEYSWDSTDKIDHSVELTLFFPNIEKGVQELSDSLAKAIVTSREEKAEREEADAAVEKEMAANG